MTLQIKHHHAAKEEWRKRRTLFSIKSRSSSSFVIFFLFPTSLSFRAVAALLLQPDSLPALKSRSAERKVDKNSHKEQQPAAAGLLNYSENIPNNFRWWNGAFFALSSVTEQLIFRILPSAAPFVHICRTLELFIEQHLLLLCLWNDFGNLSQSCSVAQNNATDLEMIKSRYLTISFYDFLPSRLVAP